MTSHHEQIHVGTAAQPADAFFTDWQQVQAATYDFIVIGTGPAGVAFVERALARDPHARILVLERGGYALPMHVQVLPPPFRALDSGAPMLGGRSTSWSVWCPAPEPALLRGWPEALVDVTRKPGFWADARTFLHVTGADAIDDSVYGCLQRQLDLRLGDNFRHCVPSALDAHAAPLAVSGDAGPGPSFHPYCTVGTLLGLWQRQKTRAAQERGSLLAIVDHCTVERLLHDDAGRVSALATSRGPLDTGDAKIVLAMGALSPATLLIRSFGARLPHAGKRCTGHLMSRIAARVKRSAFRDLSALELGACYLHGRAESGLQYHVQVSAFASSHPEQDADAIACETPDAAALPSPAQLRGSEQHVLLVCTVLGEVGEDNPGNGVGQDGVDLRLRAGPAELALWDVMDDAACQTIAALASRSDGLASAAPAIEYWIEEGDDGYWQAGRPEAHQVRLPVIVDEASALWIGEEPASSVVGLDYRPHGVDNVYVTGAALFPTAGSWNPTLTVCGLAQDLADRIV